MAHPLRNLFLHWHRLLGTKVRKLDGIHLTSDPALVPSAVRSGLYKNTYEDAERALVRQAVEPGDRVLEIGGGIGFVGMLCARKASSGQVVSYEANPAMEPIIRGNYAMNDPVPELRMRAVTADGADVTFHVADNVVSSSLVERAETSRQVTVQSDALADVLAELKPDVLVMDVEGAEVAILPSADLSGLRALIVELHPHVVGQEAIDGLMEHLRSAGFSLSVKVRDNVLMERA